MTQAFNLGLLGNFTNTAGQLDVVNGLQIPLGTASTVQHASLGVGTTAPTQTGNIAAAGTITSGVSDERLKIRGETPTQVLARLLQLEVFSYQLNDLALSLGLAQVEPELGLSAQQLQQHFPSLVVPAPIGQGYLTIRYDRLPLLLLVGMQEITSQIQELKLIIDKQKKDI